MQEVDLTIQKVRDHFDPAAALPCRSVRCDFGLMLVTVMLDVWWNNWCVSTWGTVDQSNSRIFMNPFP